MKMTERASEFERTLKELEQAIQLDELDEGSRHRLMDIANMIVDGRVTMDEAVQIWNEQPNLPPNAKVRAWHSAISLRLFARAKGE